MFLLNKRSNFEKITARIKLYIQYFWPAYVEATQTVGHKCVPFFIFVVSRSFYPRLRVPYLHQVFLILL